MIKQTNLGDHRDNNITTVSNTKNNSRIFYLNSQDSKESEKESTLKEHSINIGDDNQVSIKDILRALSFGGFVSADDDDHDTINTNNVKEITITRTVEDPKTQITNNSTGETSGLSNQLTSRSGSLTELDDNSVNALLNLVAADTNLLHKYPEIIIDKITHHDDNKTNRGGIAKAVTEKVNQAEKQNNYPLEIAKELKTLLDELQNMKAETASEANSQGNDHTNYMPPTKISRDNTPQPCGGVLDSYSLPCKSLLLSKLLEYQNLLNTDPDINTSLQFNVWGAHNARRNALIRNSRAQKLKRIHLINNMMSNFVYRPLYGYF